MHFVSQFIRLVPLAATALIAVTSLAAAQPDPEKPVTPPDSYRVVMENDRMRMIEVHIRAHSKVNVDSPANRERFLYMLSDGALILQPPGKTPYEFALHAGETAVFPAVSPVVENDTNSAVRALMVEIKQPMRTEAASRTGGGKARYAGKGKSRTAVVRVRGNSKQIVVSRGALRSATRVTTARTAAPRRTVAAKAVPSAPKTNQPLNLSKASGAKPKKISGKSKGSSS
ncbi:MAG: hypothetical protein WDO17_17775 [Alphaproteobacteria bacterium]